MGAGGGESIKGEFDQNTFYVGVNSQRINFKTK